MSREPDSTTPTWERFYDAVAGRPPHETLLLALDHFDSEAGASTVQRFAVDLGCGDGRDTAELLRRGWRVLAIDAEQEAIDRLRRRDDIDGDGARRLETAVARFEEARWPRPDLVNAGFSLPFCAPEHFPAVWDRIVASLRRGGRFSGHLFGDRDGWSARPDMTSHARGDAERLLRGFELERFDEIEEDGQTAIGNPKHWHVFHVVARKL